MSIESSGFRKLSSEPPKVRRLIVSVAGREKSGKSNFALTFPDPIAVINFDNGLEGVIEKFAHKKVYHSEYRINEIAVGKFVTEWERCAKEFRAALAEKTVRTLMVDDGTSMWELVRMARFGKLTQVMPHNYGPVNAEMRGLIRDAYSSDKNLVILHKLTQEYVNDKPTKNYVFSGFKDIPYAVQVNCLSWRETEPPYNFHLQINDCRQNPRIVGEDLVGMMEEGGLNMITYQNLGTLVFPGTSEEEWA